MTINVFLSNSTVTLSTMNSDGKTSRLSMCTTTPLFTVSIKPSGRVSPKRKPSSPLTPEALSMTSKSVKSLSTSTTRLCWVRGGMLRQSRSSGIQSRLKSQPWSNNTGTASMRQTGCVRSGRQQRLTTILKSMHATCPVLSMSGTASFDSWLILVCIMTIIIRRCVSCLTIMCVGRQIPVIIYLNEPS